MKLGPRLMCPDRCILDGGKITTRRPTWNYCPRCGKGLVPFIAKYSPIGRGKMIQ